MPLVLALISLVFTFLSPVDLFPQLAPYHPQQAILFPAVAATIASMAMRARSLRMPQDALVIGLWFAVCVSLLSKFMLRGTLDAFVTFALPVCVYFLVAANAFTMSRIRIIALAVSLTALFIALQGIGTYHLNPNSSLIIEGIESSFRVTRRIRGYGILNDPNDLAQFLLVGLALLGLFWNKRQRFVSLALLTIPAAVLLYAIYLTGSRGAIFGIAVIAVVVASTRMGGLQSMVLGVVLLVIMVAAQFGGGREISIHEGSAGERVTAWGAGILMLRSNPLFGVGFSRFGEHFADITAHNSFVLCFSELGMFGYFFWLALLVTTIWGFQRLVKVLPANTPADLLVRRTTTSLRAALLAFVVTSWFLSRTYTPMLYILLALGTAMLHMRQQENPKVELIPRRWIPATLAIQVGSVILLYLTVRARGL